MQGGVFKDQQGGQCPQSRVSTGRGAEDAVSEVGLLGHCKDVAFCSEQEG